MVTLNDLKTPKTNTWCPGCGNFGILMAFKKAIIELDLMREISVLVSGIGCAGRIPFFIKSYGINALHGRALPVATGAKISRPDLNVITVLGDGDGLGIGVGHLVHTARRNVDMLCILFDNGISHSDKQSCICAGADWDPLIDDAGSRCSKPWVDRHESGSALFGLY